MINDLRARAFTEYANPLFPALAAFLAAPALGPAPTFIPLVLLVSSILIYSKIIARRTTFSRDIAAIWIATFTGASLGQVAPSMTAFYSIATAMFSNLTLSAVPSAIAIFIIQIDRYSPLLQTPRTKIALGITLFPAAWASALQLIARFSPIGHIMSWTPVRGIDAFTWTRPYLGPWGVNWAVAALAAISADIAGTWFTDADDPEAALSSSSRVSQASDVDLLHRRGPKHILVLTVDVLLLILPSYFICLAPLPPHFDSSTALVVGCILPDLPKPGESNSLFERFLAATRTQVSVSSFNILLWPDGAVHFDSAADRDEKLRIVQEATQGSFVGVTFEEPAPNDEYGRRETRRNGLALVGPNGTVLEYYKRNLVPLVEYFSLSPSDNESTTYDVQVPNAERSSTTTPSVPERGNNATHSIPVTASISLDFAFPQAFDALPYRPGLILAPAHTWHYDASLAMWEQAHARAEEMGSVALFCDGGNGGVSGVAGHGIQEALQIGPGSWTRTIGIDKPFNRNKTMYPAQGDWVIAELVWGVLVWGVLGVGRINEIPIIQALWRSSQGEPWGERQPLLAH